MTSRDVYLVKAANAYHAQLMDERNQESLAVINGKKYLTDHALPLDSLAGQKVAESYSLGVVIDPLPGDERFTGWLAIPFLSPNGVKAIRFRNLAPDAKPKFGQHAGQPVRLFNTDAYFTDGATIGIAEGEIDAVVATERLGLPTLGVPGAEMWTAHKSIWASLFKNYQHVLVLRDGDKAGGDLADAIGETLKLRARTINMPDGMDVSSMVRAGRGDELTKQFGSYEDDSDQL